MSGSSATAAGRREPGVLTGNGAVFVGTKGIMATRERGEGVQLLPSARWKDYVLPPQLLTRSPGHMLDWVRACKGGDRVLLRFQHHRALRRVAGAGRDCVPRAGQARLGQQESALHQQRRSEQVR